MVGIIRTFPRPFTVKHSVLEDDTKSLMRYEMLAYIALLLHSYLITAIFRVVS